MKRVDTGLFYSSKDVLKHGVRKEMVRVSREYPCRFDLDGRTPCCELVTADAGVIEESLGSSTIMVCLDANTYHEYHLLAHMI